MINAKSICGSSAMVKNTLDFKGVMKVENGKTTVTDSFVCIVVDTLNKEINTPFFLTSEDIRKINKVLKTTTQLSIVQSNDKTILEGEDKKGNNHTITIKNREILYPSADSVDDIFKRADENKGISLSINTKKLLQLAKAFEKFSDQVNIKITNADEALSFNAISEDKQILKGLMMPTIPKQPYR